MKGSQSRKTELQEVSVCYTDKRQKLGPMPPQSDFNRNRAQLPGPSLQVTRRNRRNERTQSESDSGVQRLLTYWGPLRNPGREAAMLERTHSELTNETKTFSSECTRCSAEVTSALRELRASWGQDCGFRVDGEGLRLWSSDSPLPSGQVSLLWILHLSAVL